MLRFRHHGLSIINGGTNYVVMPGFIGKHSLSFFQVRSTSLCWRRLPRQVWQLNSTTGKFELCHKYCTVSSDRIGTVHFQKSRRILIVQNACPGHYLILRVNKQFIKNLFLIQLMSNFNRNIASILQYQNSGYVSVISS